MTFHCGLLGSVTCMHRLCQSWATSMSANPYCLSVLSVYAAFSPYPGNPSLLLSGSSLHFVQTCHCILSSGGACSKCSPSSSSDVFGIGEWGLQEALQLRPTHIHFPGVMVFQVWKDNLPRSCPTYSYGILSMYWYTWEITSPSLEEKNLKTQPLISLKRLGVGRWRL